MTRCRSILVLWLVTLAIARAQESSAPQDEPTPADLFFGYTRTIPDENFANLLTELSQSCTDIEANEICEEGNELLSNLFGPMYRPELPDFIVYLKKNENGSVQPLRPTLMWQGRNTPHLFGARYLYALVFSEEILPLSAGITTVYEQPRNPLTAVLSVLGATNTAADEEPDPQTSSVQIEWEPLSGDVSNTELWLGTARVPIGINSRNRVTLSFRQGTQTLTRTDGSEDPDNPDNTVLKTEITSVGPAFQQQDAASPQLPAFPNTSMLNVGGHLSNTSNSRTAFSLGLGVTFDAGDTALSQEQAINGYALAKVYIRKPRLNAREDTGDLYRRSWSVMFGTNIADDAFDEVVLGMSWGHVFGNAGFFFAGNWVPESRDEDGNSSGRDLKLLVGLEYSF